MTPCPRPYCRGVLLRHADGDVRCLLCGRASASDRIFVQESLFANLPKRQTQHR
jgi:hypothetical protein